MKALLFLASAVASACWLAALPAQAQAEFPNKTIRLLVGFPPGGSTDVLSRVLSQEVRKTTGHEIIIVNKPGASGGVAINELIASAPDGYTIAITPSTIMTLAHKFQNIRPDMLESTSALALMGRQRVGFATKADSPYKTLKDFIEAARASPGKLSVGTPGVGTMSGLIVTAVMLHEKLEVNIVPMQGDAPVATAILGGHISGGSASSASWSVHVREKTMRLLASAEAVRADAAPDVPTFLEAGYPYKSSAIQYLLAPKGLPDGVKKTLIDLFMSASKTPTYIEIAKQNDLYDPQVLTGSELDKYLLEDRAEISALVDRLGLGRK